jgi:peptidoglycan/LPS O-acetylase OafA/YrhL
MEFRPDIEGLRAIAVLVVVLFHAGVAGVGGGYVGVDVFFVISGFLITSLLWREFRTNGTVSLRRFYGARARRLLPAATVVGAVTVVFSILLLPALQAKGAIVDAIASALYMANYQFLLQGVDYLAANQPSSPFQHYWSLGVEEQFYFVWPAIILATAWFVRRLRPRAGRNRGGSGRPYIVVLLSIATVSFVLSVIVSHIMPAVAFFSLPTRAWQLAVGGVIALTAVYWRRLPTRVANVVGWLGFALILLACTLMTVSTLYPGTAAVVPVVGAAMLIAAGCASPQRGCGRLLGLRPMRIVGRLSYSWYLWHWPVLLFVPLVVGHSLGVIGKLLAAVGALLLAVLTYRWIENPFRYAPMLRRSPVASLAVGGACTAIVVCLALGLSSLVPVPVGKGAPTPALTVKAPTALPAQDMVAYDKAVEETAGQVHLAVVAAAQMKEVPVNLRPSLEDAAAQGESIYLGGCLRTFFESGQPECIFGDVDSRTRVALFGDSNAAMWAPSLRRVAEEQRWRLSVAGKALCPPMEVPIESASLRLVYASCNRWRSEALARLKTERPDLVVISMWRSYGGAQEWGGGHGWLSAFAAYSPAWVESLSVLVSEIRSWGSKVLLLGPAPDPGSRVPICLSGHLDDAQACMPRRSEAVNVDGITREAAVTEASGGQYADVTPLFCADDRCPVIVGDSLVFFDDIHLTPEYAVALAPVLGALATRTLASDSRDDSN